MRPGDNRLAVRRVHHGVDGTFGRTGAFGHDSQGLVELFTLMKVHEYLPGAITPITAHAKRMFRRKL